MPWLCLALCAVSSATLFAQSGGPRDLAELKQETQRRADRSLPPIGGVKAEDVREAMANLNSLEPDAWAAVFSRIGDRYVEKARAQQASAPREAAESYKHAWETYNFARWPVENSSGTGQAPLKVDVGAERMYSRVLDYLQTRKDVDAKRIVVRGQSWSGYWAAKLAYTERERIRGAVVHGDPKDAWVNPAGGHMGRSEQWPQRMILDRVVMPWIERALAPQK